MKKRKLQKSLNLLETQVYRQKMILKPSKKNLGMLLGTLGVYYEIC